MKGILRRSLPQVLLLSGSIGFSLYQPDLVIVGYVLNDPETAKVKEPYMRKVRNLLESESDFSKKLKEISHLYRYLHFLYYWGIAGGDLYYNDFLESLYSEKTNPYLSHTQQNLAEIIQLVKQHNGRVLIVLFPIFSLERTEEERFTKARNMLQEICDRHGAVFLNRYPAFREALKKGKAKRYWVNPFDSHPNREGHRIFAEKIFKTLVTEKWVDL